MNIKQVSYGLIGAAMMTGVFSSCYNTEYEEKAKAQAIKYLNGDQLLKAERYACQQANPDCEDGKAIAYWDSLLTEAKVKEAYAKGQMFVRDSVNRIYHRREKYNPTLDTIFTSSMKISENSRNEYAKYSNAEDFIKARDNAPDDYRMGFYNDKVGKTHYWNLITIAGKQKEAYKKGLADARKELNK